MSNTYDGKLLSAGIKKNEHFCIRTLNLFVGSVPQIYFMILQQQPCFLNTHEKVKKSKQKRVVRLT